MSDEACERRRGGGAPSSRLAPTALVVLATMLTSCARHDDAARDARVASAERPAEARGAEASQRAYDVTVAQAEGAHRVAAERCGASSGEARRSCLDRADAELERTRAAARRTRDDDATTR